MDVAVAVVDRNCCCSDPNPSLLVWSSRNTSDLMFASVGSKSVWTPLAGRSLGLCAITLSSTTLLPLTQTDRFFFFFFTCCWEQVVREVFFRRSSLCSCHSGFVVRESTLDTREYPVYSPSPPPPPPHPTDYSYKANSVLHDLKYNWTTILIWLRFVLKFSKEVTPRRLRFLTQLHCCSSLCFELISNKHN